MDRAGYAGLVPGNLALPYVERDCFEVARPVIVPARTFLAKLV